MKNYTFVCAGSSRELRKMVNALLKSGTAVIVRKINYSQTFLIKNDKVSKSDTKLLIIWTEDKTRLDEFLSKNFPQIKELEL